MFKTSVDFKIGQLIDLENQLFEINEKNDRLIFHIEGIDKSKNKYSLSFVSSVSLEEMLTFELKKYIDFVQYVDEGDIVFGKNGIYDLDTEIRMEIMRYLPRSFVINVSFKDRDNLVGSLELVFSIKK
jgi:hypothetical protein